MIGQASLENTSAYNIADEEFTEQILRPQGVKSTIGVLRTE